MRLIQYRDMRDKDFTYFYVGSKNQLLSPPFASSKEAEEWFEEIMREYCSERLKGIGRPT